MPDFHFFYVAYLKSDPAKEPIAASYSAPGAHKTGRRKDDFEIREISKNEYERIKKLLLWRT